MKKVVNTNKAPLPIGPYSQAVMAGNFLFVSGQIPINPETNELVLTNIKAQSVQVMENIKAILIEAGLDFSDIVKVSIFLTDMVNFAEINEVYGSYFKDNYPARETIQVCKLPKNVDVEISVIAAKL